MCVYLAPRWRRRSSPLQLAAIVLALALLLLTAEGRTLRSQETGNSGSGSTSVSEQEVGVVTPDTKQNTTTVTTRAWNSGDASQFGDEKFVSFDSLVKTTTAPPTTAPEVERSTEQQKQSASSSSTSTDNEIQATTLCSGNSSSKGKSHTDAGDTRQGDDDDDNDGSFDDGSNDESADSTANSKSTNDKITSKTGTTNKAPTPAPTPTPTSGKSTQGPPHPGSFDARPKGWTSSSSSNAQSVEGQACEQSDPTNSAKAFKNKTKSASLTTSSRSLDETLVVVIVGVVGAIGALLMFASRKVLKETGDDKDLEDSSFF